MFLLKTPSQSFSSRSTTARHLLTVDGKSRKRAGNDSGEIEKQPMSPSVKSSLSVLVSLLLFPTSRLQGNGAQSSTPFCLFACINMYNTFYTLRPYGSHVV